MMTGQTDTSASRLPRYGNPRVEEYTREGHKEDQERVKVVRKKTVLTGSLTGEGTSETTIEETLADFPAGNAYHVMCALAEHFNSEVVEK